MKQTFEILKNSIDKNRLFNNVKEVSSFHRIQATPGYRQAAGLCQHWLLLHFRQRDIR